MTKEELKNYEPKGELTGFPKEIIARMLDCQEEQGNKRDVTVFEKYKDSAKTEGGFDWDKAKEGDDFWVKVIIKENFNIFFEKYPKKEDNQEFRVGDKVYDIILGKVGIVKEINLQAGTAFLLKVDFENYGTVFYPLEGKSLSRDKYPRLLHYRDDYDYSIIDFKNLPKRQEPKRWRAEVGELYYLIHLEDMGFCRGAKLDKYNEDANEYYEYGNYFKTEEEAQEVANKLNKYFKQLINK